MSVGEWILWWLQLISGLALSAAVWYSAGAFDEDDCDD